MSQWTVSCGFLVILLVGKFQSEHTSKACYGTPEILCTSHHLDCINGTIAILEAYYTDDTQCGGGLSSCSVNVDNIPDTGNHNEFNASEWAILQRNCSSKSRCEFKAGRRVPMFFSVVKYNCSQKTKTSVSEKITSTVSTSASTISVRDAMEPPLTDDNAFPGGIFMAGVVTGAGIICVLVLVVYMVIIKRRCGIKSKKQDDESASVEHPTYSGLSAKDSTNTYDAIGQDAVINANDKNTDNESSKTYENV